ncbi:MAG TPA: M48 family metallopeptidase [Terriglobales bacterium]|nr:M48 family metallopeptidase [Terriglobales bacterium]
MRVSFPVQRVRVAILTVLLAIGVGCATKNIVQQPTGRFQLQGGGYNAFSPEQEIQLGQQAAQEAAKQLPVLPENDPLTRYVQQLGQSLAAKAPGEVKWPFSFHVVNQKEINAFALPGGPIFINVGTIREADDEGQLAGVIAHEISHVVLRHGTQQASKQQMAQLPLAILGGVLPQGVGGQLARLGLSFGAQSIFLKYSRDAETEADLLGSQILYDSGYNPYDMVEFFSKLEKEGGAGVPQFLSDHPNPGNRVVNVRQAIEKYPRKKYRNDTPQFERAKSTAMKMKPLTAEEIAQRQQAQQPQMGSLDPQAIMPSDQFQTLNHNAFQIGYPSNWKVFGDANSPITIAPEAGVSQNAVAYGVIISGFRGSDPQAGIERATSELVQQMQQANPQLQVARRPQGVQVGGTEGIAVDMVSPSPVTSQGQTLAERDMLVTVPRGDGTYYYMIFIAPQAQFQDLSPAYEEMLRSFRMR